MVASLLDFLELPENVELLRMLGLGGAWSLDQDISVTALITGIRYCVCISLRFAFMYVRRSPQRDGSRSTVL